MRKILRAIGSGVGITLIVTLVLSAVLWLLGPFFAFGEARPFEGLTGRLIGLGVLWILALVIVLILLIRAQKRDDKLAEEIVATPDTGPAGDIGVGDEMTELREKLRTALGKLRRAKGGRRHLAQLPWYVIIGPPGAGKTTAIVNSGLSFPLAEEIGAGSIGGVGGTRNCDWWFTDNAVLVDTAGRYTTQESDASADNAGWLGFLGLLKKYRKRQPINGAVVAISLSDLLMQDPATQKAHGAAIRRRLHELREKLGVRFPVYVLFTKADLIAGFTETFDRLPKEGREQVWGFTLPLPQGRNAAPAIAGFDEEFGLLIARLNVQVLERIQAESDPPRRSLIAGFPGQLASMRQIARDFLTEVFQENRYEHRQMLRGVYFASGTQEGTPIDRLMMGMARSFGIGRQAIGTGRGTGRSFFLTRLFDGVIFPEAGLVSSDDRVERRYRWMRHGAVAATVLIAGGIGFAWFQFWQENGRQRQEVADRIGAYRAEAAAIPAGPVADSDLPLVVPALEHLRVVPGAGAPVTQAGVLAWGLDQSAVIGNEAKLAWRDALNRHFLPRLLVRLEDQMQSSINDPVVLFDLLKVYLMLGQIGPMDEALVKEYFTADWERLYGGASREDLRRVLALHLDALLAGPMKKIDLNADLVAQVQDILTRMPQAQRIYNGIVQTDAARALPAWRPTDIGGPAIARAFTRSSGRPLNEGIEGIYTRKGFYEVFLPEALRVSAQIQRDAFVLGPTASQDLSDAAQTALSRDVLALYYNDYVARYDQMLSDLDIIPLESLPHAVEVTNVLSGPASPLRNVLGAIADETRLTVDPSTAPALPTAEAVDGALAAADGLSSAAGSILSTGALGRLPSQSRRILDALSEPAVPGGEPVPPGAYVEERFAAIQDLVTAPEGAPSPLDTLIASLTEVNQELNKLAFSGGVGSSETAGPAIQGLVQAASQLPGPIQRWVSQVVSGSSGITADGTRAGINAKWQAEVLPLCQQATENKYPFSRRAAADISIQDFTTLFAPGGLIDKFFLENLAEHVDQRARPWTFRKVNDADLGISPQVLLQMQHAAEIRDAFFAAGPVPKVQFQMTPEALDPKASSIVLELDGQRVAFAQGEGQPTPSAIGWPGAVGLGRITMEPPLVNGESTISRDGPWALFRLLDAAEIRRTNVADRTRVIFKVGGRIAIFGMQSGSVKNPFALAALTEFKCPASF